MMYRIVWEMVDLRQLVRYSSADPSLYKKTKQTVPNSLIPDDHWHVVTRETDDPWDQYATLKEWSDGDREFVRNVRVEKMTTSPSWKAVEL